jgi:glycosyltransferase involved in cell wall biosynthesis
MNESSGGGSGVNSAVYEFFKENSTYFSYQYINPQPNKVEKLISRLQKLFGLKRNYYFFSESRLNKIKDSFIPDENADFYFFHGFTPWIKIKPDKPYFCFNDACFATYVTIYNNKDEFQEKDLNRIYNTEKKWLLKARTVFFRSQWALHETQKAYNVEGSTFLNVAVGGFIDIPNEDFYKNGFNFVFIAREFIPKGGEQTVEAFKIVRQEYPAATLTIIGEKPNDDILSVEGINYLGFLNKNIPAEKDRLIDCFSTAFAIVHPTIKDTNTLVINELSYYGCPAISSNRFAIPEYIVNGKTGYLLDNPRDIDEIAGKMSLLLNDQSTYLEMRKATRNRAVLNFTWSIVNERIIYKIKEKIN